MWRTQIPDQHHRIHSMQEVRENCIGERKVEVGLSRGPLGCSSLTFTALVALPLDSLTWHRSHRQASYARYGVAFDICDMERVVPDFANGVRTKSHSMP